MKPIKFITTFSKTGYEVYGKSWIKTFLENVNDQNVSADVYIDFPSQFTGINVINFDSAIPNHKSWLSQFEHSFGGDFYHKKMGMRFSYKSFVMMHAIKNNSGCYLIWLDGDCIFKPNQDFSNFPSDILNGNFIAVQKEKGSGHCESGIVIFDLDHPDKDKFLSNMENNYRIENIIKMSSPFDGFVIHNSIHNVSHTDLNDGWGRDGIQSDPNETFLNPAIGSRFLHNIGITGKNQYENWQYYANNDEYFKLLFGRGRKSQEEINQIRQNLLNIRNRR